MSNFLRIPVLLISVFFGLLFLTNNASAQNIQIDPAAAQPPLCRWVAFRSDRQQWGSTHQEMCYRYVGRTLYSIGSTPVWRYGGVPASGYRPSYCYLNQDFLAPVELGSRGDTYCPPLNDAVQLTVSADKVSEGGKFTIGWSAFTAKQCVLSGKAPETGNFSETFNGTSNPIGSSGSSGASFSSPDPMRYRTFDFVKRGIYTFQFACTGYLNNVNSTNQGTITRTVTVFVGDIPPPPTVELSIEPSVITKGEKATITWRVNNAVTSSINQGIGVVRASGSTTVSPNITTRYTITAAGEFPELGLARKSVTLRVVAPEVTRPEEEPIEVPPDVVPEAPPPVEAPKIDLKVNGEDGPLTFGAPASFTLSWNLDRYCIAYGSWLGVKRTAGQERRTETRAGTYTYKLYCPLVGTDEVVVNVTGGPGRAAVPLPVAEASISTDGENFSRSIRVTKGEPTRIWVSAATDVNGDGRASRDETGGWTSLMSLGGRCEWNTDLNQGEPTFEAGVFDPQSVEECTASLGELTFYDEPGVYNYGLLRLVQNDGKVSAISYVNIAVNDPPLPDGPPVISLTVSGQEDEVVLGAPAEYALVWNVRNADSCSASGDWSGNRFPSGSQQFVTSEKKELTYTLTCVGKLGQSAKSIRVKVAELPVCDFSAVPTVIDGQSAFNRQSALSWTCQFANTCSISPEVGLVSTFGSTRVSPQSTTNYTLTCENLDGRSSFEQRVEVR